MARTKMAMSVPHTLNRPGRICVAPRKHAAKAGSRNVAPNVSDGPVSEVYSTPARPEMAADAMSEPHAIREVLTPESRAASGLAPVAYIRRPRGICDKTHHTTS